MTGSFVDLYSGSLTWYNYVTETWEKIPNPTLMTEAEAWQHIPQTLDASRSFFVKLQVGKSPYRTMLEILAQNK